MPTSRRTLLILDREAVESTRRALRTWQPATADPATPCAGWRLTDLVAHMTIQQRGFARAIAGERTEPQDWQPVKHADPITAYEEACDEVDGAFAAVVQAEHPVFLPEVGDEPLPIDRVVGFHLVDNLVHAWDVARSLGVELAFDHVLAETARDIARQVPDGETREQPGAAFAHQLPIAPGSSAMDETLLLLGRDPGWAE